MGQNDDDDNAPESLGGPPADDSGMQRAEGSGAVSVTVSPEHSVQMLDSSTTVSELVQLKIGE